MMDTFIFFSKVQLSALTQSCAQHFEGPSVGHKGNEAKGMKTNSCPQRANFQVGELNNKISTSQRQCPSRNTRRVLELSKERKNLLDCRYYKGLLFFHPFIPSVRNIYLVSIVC
jgi:hypothetical protein